MNSFLRILPAGLVFVSVLNAQNIPTAPIYEQVRNKYLSRTEIQARLDQYKNEHAVEFPAVRNDFDLAIRSMLTLDLPEPAAWRTRVGKPKKDPLPSFYTRKQVLDDVAMYSDRGDNERAGFYSRHLEEISVDQTVALRMLCIDVLLNGWNDWSNWQSEKLRTVHEKYPDVHLDYALRCIRFLKTPEDYEITRPAVGLALELVMDRSNRSAILASAAQLVHEVGSISKDTDLLRFSIDTAMRTTDKGTRLSFLTIAGQISKNLGQPAQREFWVAYLDVPDEWIRTMAVSGIVESIRKPRPGEPTRPRDAELAQLLRNVAQNDHSERVRQFLHPRLEQYERSDTKPTHGGGRIGDPSTPLP